jgi:hypothetical protein
MLLNSLPIGKCQLELLPLASIAAIRTPKIKLNAKS